MPEELLGVATSVLVEEEEKSFVCRLIPTILTILGQAVHPFTPFYMVENTILLMAHTMTYLITMLPVLSAWLPPELQ